MKNMVRMNPSPSETTNYKAVRVSELKEAGHTYPQIKKFFPYHTTWLIELKKLGDELRKEQNENA
jgi:hypothetical protein